MNYIDIIIIVPIIIGFLIGFKNGLLIELSRIVGLGLGIFFATRFTNHVIDLIGITGKYSYEIGYVISIIGVIILVSLIAKLLTNLFDAINLNTINRVLGGIVCCMKYALLVCVVGMIFESFNSKSELIDNSELKESKLYPTVLSVSDVVFPHIGKFLNSPEQTINNLINFK